MTGYIIEYKGQQFSPDGRVSVANAQQDNKALEQRELAAWAKQPAAFTAYVTEDDNGRKLTVTTWLGTVLGTVISSRTYRGGFGGRMRSIVVRGTNGRCYHGKYGYDWRQCVNLYRSKGGQQS